MLHTRRVERVGVRGQGVASRDLIPAFRAKKRPLPRAATGTPGAASAPRGRGARPAHSGSAAAGGGGGGAGGWAGGRGLPLSGSAP